MKLSTRTRSERGLRLFTMMLVTMLAAQGCGGDDRPARRSESPRATRPTGLSPSAPGQSPGAVEQAPENRAGERRTIGGVETVIRGQASTLPGSVDIQAHDNYYKPNILTGIPDTAIVVAIKNEGKVRHNFSVTGQGVDQDIEPGQAPSVVVSFPGSGRVVFFCEYHRDDGMVGELQVT